MKEIYLLRHGQSEGNLHGILAGRTDIPLTPEGEQQAIDAGRRLGEWKPDRVLCSPLQRAYRTACLALPGADLVILEDLQEISFGDLEGRTWTEAEKTMPDLLKEWMRGGVEFALPHGESLCDVYRRVTRTIQPFIETDCDEKIMIVAHWGVITSLLSWWTTGNAAAADHFDIQPGRIAQVKIHQGFPVLSALNV